MKVQCFRLNKYKLNEHKSSHLHCYAPVSQPAFDVFFKAKKTAKEFENFDFVKKRDIVFFHNVVNSYPQISKSEILRNLDKISKMEKLEGHNKLNLIEHVITKKIRGEERDFNKLIDHIKYFSKNPDLNSIIIADSSKYLLEEPEVDRNAFHNILSFVVKNAKFKDVASVMKISKLINLTSDKKELLLILISAGFSSPQIKCVASLPVKFLETLMLADNINELDTNTKFEYYKLLNNTNEKVFDSKMKSLFPTFPKDKDSYIETKNKLEESFSSESPLVIEPLFSLEKHGNHNAFNTSDNMVLKICNSILENNKPNAKFSPKIFYEQKAFQSISDLQVFDLTCEQQNKIYRIINSIGLLLDKEQNYSPEIIALYLRYKNTYDLLRAMPIAEKIGLTKLKEVGKLVNFLKENTNAIVQTDFESEKYTEKRYKDGTVNKIVEYNIKSKDNPKVFLHAAGFELSGLIPNNKTSTGIEQLYNANSNKIFSTTLLSGNDFKPFRTYGFVLSSDVDDILGGVDYDLASGFDKSIEDFGAKYLKNSSEIFTYFPKLIKDKTNMKKSDYIKFIEKINAGDEKACKLMLALENLVSATERIDGRRYNEFLLVNPIITGVYVYGNLDSLPYEFRKFAQEKNLKILHIKKRERAKSNAPI